jgi:hypothetical protein
LCSTRHYFFAIQSLRVVGANLTRGKRVTESLLPLGLK